MNEDVRPTKTEKDLLTLAATAAGVGVMAFFLLIVNLLEDRARWDEERTRGEAIMTELHEMKREIYHQKKEARLLRGTWMRAEPEVTADEPRGSETSYEDGDWRIFHDR